MKQITKNETPAFLSVFLAKKHPSIWDDIAPIRQDLRKYILEEQGSCCAYTEIRIVEDNDCHIDHYLTRNLFPEKTFEYKNMFVACNSENYGAKYKDKQVTGKSDYAFLVNPAEENPLDFLEFSFTGNVYSINENEKGVQTISSFNLNEETLVERRKTSIYCLLQMKEWLNEEEMVEAIGEFETMVRQLYRAALG